MRMDRIVEVFQRVCGFARDKSKDVCWKEGGPAMWLPEPGNSMEAERRMLCMADYYFCLEACDSKSLGTRILVKLTEEAWKGYKTTSKMVEVT